MSTVHVKQEFVDVLNSFKSQNGQTFAELSAAAPVMLIFLRHLSCPFCRRVLRDVASVRKKIEGRGVTIAFVHMAEEAEAMKLFKHFRIHDLPRFSDKRRQLYRLAGLRPMRLGRLLSYKMMREGLQIGRELKDAPRASGGSLMQMPGVFLIDQGHVLAGESVLDFDIELDLLTILDAA